MKLAVVGYPRLDSRDREWIEGIRATHDPQASLIDVHFTLVFPFEGTTGEVEPAVAAIAKSWSPFTFTIDRAIGVPDAFGSGTHVFLIPAEGRTAIEALHEHLYEGALSAHLRRDIRFVPHLTVALAADGPAADRLAHALNPRAIEVRGLIESLDVVVVEGPRVRSSATCVFGGR
jgi:2'-5' RNA ligase